jgi:hypothetical protein
LLQRPHLPCFDVPEISQIRNDGKLQFKKGIYNVEDKGKITVEGEWLNGVPHGICIVENERTRGIMTFTHGKPNGGPAWFEFKENGAR